MRGRRSPDRQALVEEIVRLRNNGLTYKAIAETIGGLSDRLATSIYWNEVERGTRQRVSLGQAARRMYNQDEDAILIRLRSAGKLVPRNSVSTSRSPRQFNFQTMACTTPERTRALSIKPV